MAVEAERIRVTRQQVERAKKYVRGIYKCHWCGIMSERIEDFREHLAQKHGNFTRGYTKEEYMAKFIVPQKGDNKKTRAAKARRAEMVRYIVDGLFMKPTDPPRQCPHCKNEFRPTKHLRKFCSGGCRDAVKRARAQQSYQQKKIEALKSPKRKSRKRRRKFRRCGHTVYVARKRGNLCPRCKQKQRYKRPHSRQISL